MSKKRKNPAARRNEILKAAVELAIKIGYKTMTRDGIASHAGVSTGLVTHYFETMVQLRRAVMRYAITHEKSEIIAQGLANKDNQALKSPEKLKAEALKLIANY